MTELTFNLADLFESVADTVPDRTAVVSEQRRLNFREMDERANRLANAWAVRGIGKGHHIGLQLRNGSEYIEGMIAAYKLRAVPININYHYVAGELDYLYRDADLAALVVHQDFAARAAPVVAEIEALQQVYCVADESGAPVDAGFHDYEDTLANSSPQRDFPPRASDDLYIVYTGGTTGMPKGVMWNHQDIFFAAMGGGDADQTQGPISEPEELVGRIPEFPLVILPIPPFMHAAAQWSALTALFGGGKVVIPASGRFEPDAIWQIVDEEGVLMLVVVGDAIAGPLADALEANTGRWNTSQLQVIASGGALFSPAVKKRLLALCPNTMILDGLGSSETGLMGNKVNAEATNDISEPVFMVNEHMTVLDDNYQPIAPGSGGTGMLARRGHIPLGYYKAPEKSATTFVEINGARWAIPGDLAMVEADGTIRLLGRGSVSINTGGEKVFPEEVEAAIKEHDNVRDAVVVGLADERFGQKVVAVCATRSGQPLELQQLRDFCADRLAPYKLPRDVVCLDQLKRSPAGKADYPWAKAAAQQALAAD